MSLIVGYIASLFHNCRNNVTPTFLVMHLLSGPFLHFSSVRASRKIFLTTLCISPSGPGCVKTLAVFLCKAPAGFDDLIGVHFAGLLI
jgi:hypothetical protein